MDTNINKEPETQVLLAVYEEICKSYHAIDDFRTKLLGLLPASSLVGLFLINATDMIEISRMPKDLIGFAAVFAAMLTLAFFGYEIRGIRRSHQLINEGLHLEQQLGIKHGQFHICVGQQCADEHDSYAMPKIFNSKLTACLIYSVVFSAWLLIALRLGMNVQMYTCAISATIVGLILAASVFMSVKKFYAA